jgi:serine protease
MVSSRQSGGLAARAGTGGTTSVRDVRGAARQGIGEIVGQIREVVKSRLGAAIKYCSHPAAAGSFVLNFMGSHMFNIKSRLLTAVAATTLLSAVTGVAVAKSTVAAPQVVNPYSPANGHAYRHGVVPTREAHVRMQQYRALHAASQTTAATGTETLSYGGGVDGIGVTSGAPKVYVVVYGSQWGTAGTDANGNMTLTNDPVGAVPYLQNLFKGLGTGGELWSGVMTQYCDGSLVSNGATFCPSGAPHIGYPTGGVIAGVWYDNSVASPSQATGAQLAQEAIKAAQHFGNTTAASNRYVQYVILSPTGTHPDGFNTSSGQFCAWHDWNGDQSVTSPVGDVAFTNMPYVYDMGTSCGKGSVNGSSSQGNLDGFSLVEGHEYAETVTDQNPAGGWTNHTGSSYNGQENGDECAWISSGQGASANVVMGPVLSPCKAPGPTTPTSATSRTRSCRAVPPTTRRWRTSATASAA